MEKVSRQEVIGVILKLFLTSSGITNRSLSNALKKLVKNRKIRIAFIPTSANTARSTNKSWLIRNLNDCLKLGTVDIVDISALNKRIWLPRLKAANVILMGGGDTVHLMKCINKSGLKKELPSLLKRRIYVGISAGSMILAPKISASSDFLYNRNPNNAPAGLGYVDFNFRSHFNEDNYPRLRDKNLRKLSKKLKGDLYALDNNSGLLCIDGKIEIVSEGRWKKYSGKK